MRVHFIKSAVYPEDYPVHRLPEVALIGRSNAGKSSFLNALTSQKAAFVSKEAGKTRLLNFFEVGEHYSIVDLPGYGFASRDNKEMAMWQKMIESYLLGREQLAGFLLLMDSRRDWTEEEEILKKLASRRELPLCVILTKKDKLTRQELVKTIPKIRKQSGLENVFLCSNLKKDGVKEVEDFVFRNWVKK